MSFEYFSQDDPRNSNQTSISCQYLNFDLRATRRKALNFKFSIRLESFHGEESKETYLKPSFLVLFDFNG